MNKLQLQPINTAPKDGTKVFGVNEHDDMMICYFDKRRGEHWFDDAGDIREPKFWSAISYELPPRKKTVAEDVEHRLSELKFDAATCEEMEMVNRCCYAVLNILRKRKGEVIE